MKRKTKIFILGISILVTGSVFAEGTRIDDTTIDVSSSNTGTINSSISSRRSVISTGAVNLDTTTLRRSLVINSSTNENTSNIVENGRKNTVTTGSITAR